jgi:uncharacterized protein YbjT (DUF2867 family)
MMRIVVLGGTGFIGSKVVSRLRRLGHQVSALSRGSGVDVAAGNGLRRALAGAEIVINTIDARLPDPTDMLKFFVTTEKNISNATQAVGVSHYVALSMLGADRLALNGYFLAKLLQEDAIRTSGQPFTIIRSAPFFESLYAIIGDAHEARQVRLPPVPVQAMAAQDAADAIVAVALGPPIGDVIEIVGPEIWLLTDLAVQVMGADEDTRDVIADGSAPYLGTVLGAEKLVSSKPWRIGGTRFEDWLRSSVAAA